MKASHTFESLAFGPGAAAFHKNRSPRCENVEILGHRARFGLARYRLGASMARSDDAVEECERKAYILSGPRQWETSLVKRTVFPWIEITPR